MQSALLDSTAVQGSTFTTSSSFGGGSARPPHLQSDFASDRPAVGAGYGARPGGSAKAFALTLALHGAAILALASAGYSAIDRNPPEVLQMFDMKPEVEPPPPPPPQELVVPDEVPVVQQVVAPPAKIEMPTFNKIVTTPKAPEEPKAAVVAATTPSQAVEPAPPAPIVPPDFNAGQLNNPGPAYPYLSKKAKEEGVVMLKVLVGTNGRAKTVTVNRSSGSSRLDDAALGAVRKWRFLPATQAGQPVEAWVLVPITFKLDR